MVAKTRPPELQAWPWQDTEVMWSGARRRIPAAGVIAPDGRIFNIYDVSGLFPDVDKNWKRSRSEVLGFAMHHDGVLFSGKDANFDGHTLDESLTRLRADYQHATVTNKWNGISYHAVVDLEGRIFIARKDVLDTHRAHVAGYDPSTGKKWNHTTIGVCLMGNYADAIGADGKKVAMQADRPPQAQLDGANAFMQYVTNLFDRELSLWPHKYFARFPGQSWKPCPGESWVGDLGWSGDPVAPFRYKPAATVVTPTPDPPATRPPGTPAAKKAEIEDILDEASELVIKARQKLAAL